MEGTVQACERAPTPVKLVLGTRAWCVHPFPPGQMESSLVALPWKVALCPLVLGGMVLRSWRVGWEQGVMSQ